MTGTGGDTTVREIERRAAAAWPAAFAEERDGWLLRHTPGVGRQRSNSALPPPPGTGTPGIGLVERFYGERGLPVRVQVSPAEEQGELDAALAEAGYRRTGVTAVLTAPTEKVVAATASAPPLPVRLADTPDRWLGVFTELDGHDDSAAVGREVLSRVPSPAAFLSVVVEDRPAGMGLVVAAGEWAGVFCMATAPDRRRTGVAAAVLAAGARWARVRGAERLYLQVERDNEAALGLYTRAGFSPSHGYHYRVRP
ncbi:GNAT family N-acetyltransferase [Streptosporangium saharense]|uniref:GNAT family N-acetyltransferase n=1 Tax=Streptosporangium saharense TaxID=1706840 RepID=UPI0036CF400A